MKFSELLINYRNSIKQVNAYIDIAYRTDNNGAYVYNSNEINFIVTSAYLRMFVAWETFLEMSFINYLLGRRTMSGNFVKRHVKPLDEVHAHKILIGVNKYVDWANHEIVRKLAVLYLENGRPYKNILASIQTDLADLKTVRNSAAHVSTTTQHQLDALASRKLGRVVHGITVDGFISAMDPSNTSNTILQSYQDMLDAAAENIAKNII